MKVEVNNTQKNEQVDWSKNPQLVVSLLNAEHIVLTSENQTEVYLSDCFIGTQISSGHWSNSWAKSVFKPFYGTITLQND